MDLSHSPRLMKNVRATQTWRSYSLCVSSMCVCSTVCLHVNPPLKQLRSHDNLEKQFQRATKRLQSHAK